MSHGREHLPGQPLPTDQHKGLGAPSRSAGPLRPSSRAPGRRPRRPHRPEPRRPRTNTQRSAAQRRVTIRHVWTVPAGPPIPHRDPRRRPLRPLVARAVHWHETRRKGRPHLGRCEPGGPHRRSTHRPSPSVRGKPVQSLGKTSAAHRRIQLDDPVPTLLTHYRQSQRTRLGDPGPGDAVFTNRSGQPPRPDGLTRRFQALARELELPPIGLHGLRHTAATLMLLRGADVFTDLLRAHHAGPDLRPPPPSTPQSPTRWPR